MLPDSPQQLTLFVGAVKDFSFGVGVRMERVARWKTKTSSLGKYITAADAAHFAISMVMGNLVQILFRAGHYSAEVVTDSRVALTAIEDTRDWTLSVITGITEQTLKVEDAGGRVTLTWLANRNNYEGYKFADAAA